MISAHYDDDNGADSGSAYIYYNDGVFVEEEHVNIPDNTILLGNNPNPFNPVTTISYQLPEDCDVELTIYNIKGQLVKTLVNEIKPPGEHSIIWNGRDDSDKSVSSGIYFYKLKSDNFEKTRKMILLK